MVRRLDIFRSVFLVAVLAWALTSCRNDANSNVPSYPVQLDLDIYRLYPHFVVEGGFQVMTFTEKRWDSDYLGYGGVIVWVNLEGKYCAADMTCPHCLQPKQPVFVDGLYAVCPVCGEHFDLTTYAFPTMGKADQPLRPYNATFSNGILRIRN